MKGLIEIAFGAGSAGTQSQLEFYCFLLLLCKVLLLCSEMTKFLRFSMNFLASFSLFLFDFRFLEVLRRHRSTSFFTFSTDLVWLVN